jgi:hypothetical protein
MNLIRVLQKTGEIQAVLFNQPEDAFVRQFNGNSKWFFRINNTEIEEICISDQAISHSIFPVGSLTYEIHASNHYKKYYEPIGFSEFYSMRTKVIQKLWT